MSLKGAFLIPHKAQHRPEQLARPCVPTQVIITLPRPEMGIGIGMVLNDLDHRKID